VAWDNVYIFYIIGGILSIVSIYYLVKHRNDPAPPKPAPQNKEVPPVKENHYPELRERALTITADQLGFQFDENNIHVYGVVMEYDMDKAILTLVAYQTGDASMYISNGGAFIGGIGQDNIKAAALSFVLEAQNYPTKAILTTETPLPPKDCVQFYLLTNKGIYFHRETIASMNPDWVNFGIYGHKVISQYRISTEKQK